MCIVQVIELKYAFSLNNTNFPVYQTQTMHSWVGEDLPARTTTASSGPGEGNLEEKCKQVD